MVNKVLMVVQADHSRWNSGHGANSRLSGQMTSRDHVLDIFLATTRRQMRSARTKCMSPETVYSFRDMDTQASKDLFSALRASSESNKL